MQSDKLSSQVFTILDDQKAMEIISLRIKEISSIADYMIVCSGRSTRHVSAIASNLVELLKKQTKIKPLSVTGMESGEWVLVDYGDVLVNIMVPATREFYSLEELWQMQHPKIMSHA